MAFAIMRAKKLSGMGSVAASMQHCYRDRDTPVVGHTRTSTLTTGLRHRRIRRCRQTAGVVTSEAA